MLLEVNQATKLYKRGNDEFKAVDNASLSLGQGEYAVINGQSGSGKSTLLAIIAGLLNMDSGQASFDGTDIGTLGDKKLSALRNEKIGFIPQGQCLLSNFTIIDNVALPGLLAKRKNSRERAKALLDRLGIARLANQYPARLSGGEIRRAAIARGLVNEPKLVVADEPTSDLDPANSLNIFELFNEIALSGAAVLVVTHESQKPNGCHKRYLMNDGVLLLES
jgi:putative ABC transport system ATP-binding protein